MPDDNTNLLIGAGLVSAAAVGAGVLYLAYGASPVPQLEAVLSANPTLGVAPLPVQFTVLSGDTVVQPATYAWDFGDGTTATLGTAGSGVSHVYEAAGTYQAAVLITDERGETASLSTVITVQNPVAGKTPVDLGATLDPTSGTTSTTINTLGSLVVLGVGGVVGATVTVTDSGSPLTTITTDQYGEWNQGLGVFSIGQHVIAFTYAGDSQYDPAGSTQVLTITS